MQEKLGARSPANVSKFKDIQSLQFHRIYQVDVRLVPCFFSFSFHTWSFMNSHITLFITAIWGSCITTPIKVTY